jgi:spermidine/putrescine transport system substrate-binding protein
VLFRSNIPKDERYNFTKNGLTLPINLDNVPNYQKLLPGLARQPWAIDGGQVYAVPIVHGFYSLAYNAAVIKNAPTSWSVFWDPEYAGRYTVNHDYYELNLYITALAMGQQREGIFHYDTIKGQTLENRLHYLARNAGLLWDGYDRPEHYKNAVLATTWRFTFPEWNPSFKNWRVAEPKEGTPWTMDTIMLGSSLADNPLLKAIAESWINFLLEPNNQLTIFAEQLGTCPVTTEAWNIYTEKILSSTERQRLKRLFHNLIPWQVLETRDRNAFNLLWREALTDRKGLGSVLDQ